MRAGLGWQERDTEERQLEQVELGKRQQVSGLEGEAETRLLRTPKICQSSHKRGC